jgi:DUF2889 family protein
MTMELFGRTKEYRVTWSDDRGSFTSVVDMRDAFHDMGVTVTFSYPELEIRSVDPRMSRTPYPICPSALALAQSCVGLKVQPAISLMLTRQIGGPEGCAHMTNLVVDACHSAVQGLLAIRRIDEGDTSVVLSPEAKIAYLDGHGIPTRDSCVAFAVAEPR